ncbi:FAD-binding-3 domain-containing protein [Favolaschia claudopus]|uniref:FAD-binding-3 domain-containing protein n=1 Tax=Favolaschia claudopus TaxID=2862362 RepID=A0AAW0CTR8_9AGAR
MSLPRRTTILIVGAGPAGMAAAMSLKHQGINDFVVVDAIRVPGGEASRAVVIQAATLEALNNVGCLDGILPMGNKVERLSLHDDSSYLLSADFSLLSNDTKFPAKYVIGADGAHSVIRSEAGISFQDPDGNETHEYGNLTQMVFADVTFNKPLEICTPTRKVSLTISGGNMLLLAPLPASSFPDSPKTVYRISSSVPVEFGTAPPSPPADYFDSLIAHHGPPELAQVKRTPIIDNVLASSRYRTRSAIAERYFTRHPDGGGGMILLIGDSAHIHSPFAGQGMSLGIRDAISLGPVLRAHMDSPDGTTSDELFEQWSVTRYARARTVVALTKRGLGIMNIQRLMWAPLLNVLFAIIRFFGRLKFVQRQVAYRLSGLAEI